MKNLATILSVLALSAALSACKKEESAPPVVGTWTFVSQSLDVSAADPTFGVLVQAALEADPEDAKSVPRTFRKDKTWSNAYPSLPVEEWPFGIPFGGTYRLAADSLFLTVTPLDPNLAPVTTGYRIILGGNTMQLERSVDPTYLLSLIEPWLSTDLSIQAKETLSFTRQ